MLDEREIQARLSFLSSLSLIVESFEEIAVSRIQRVRNAVLYKREFLGRLSEVFQEVTSSFQDEIAALMRKKKAAIRTERTVFVFLSANTGLYGDIVQKTFRLFLASLRKEKSLPTIVIIGRLGRILFQREMPKTTFRYFDFPDSTIDKKVFRDIVSYLLGFQNVLIFYGEFRNIVSQVPTVSTIAGSQLPKGEQSTTHTKYIFEPSLKGLVKFFEEEIFTSLFEQRLHESQLAKFASRIITLDSSREHIEESQKSLFFEKQRARHRIINRKQQDLLAGVSLWRR